MLARRSRCARATAAAAYDALKRLRIAEIVSSLYRKKPDCKLGLRLLAHLIYKTTSVRYFRYLVRIARRKYAAKEGQRHNKTGEMRICGEVFAIKVQNQNYYETSQTQSACHRRRNVIDQQHIPKSYLIRTEFSDCGLMVRRRHQTRSYPVRTRGRIGQ
ncbi:hypothetical protein EVAR_27789_1 [Eumeta japonica]|uniref:Uncharacterized protein n=1 Tax=Eumeta variegata TaxID=151549 RepID=A0A4C1VL60_EUMVA|nr:hypothetical protein EVAR_27789_1 [Eumeta japonica]